MVYGLGLAKLFRVYDVGCRIYDVGCRVYDVGCRV
jgi:hypothetical protein